MQSEKLAAGARYCVASPNIVWQAFDEESVVINLESGVYFSLNLSGALIWRLLEAGLTPAEAAERSIDAGAPAEAREQIPGFCERLLQEGLIAASTDGTQGQAAIAEVTFPWDPPAVSVYTDMQDLFLLDPIHDVDESGWPSRPTETH